MGYIQESFLKRNLLWVFQTPFRVNAKATFSKHFTVKKKRTKKPTYKRNGLPLTPQRVNPPKYRIKPILIYYQANTELMERGLILFLVLLDTSPQNSGKKTAVTCWDIFVSISSLFGWDSDGVKPPWFPQSHSTRKLCRGAGGSKTD